MGMIGGGIGSLIGPVHRMAAELDCEIELVAGAFSRDAERSRAAAISYKIDPDRGYPDIATLIAQEANRTDGIDFVAVVSPNDNHLPAARAALEAGIPVLSDKPATATYAQAVELAKVAKAASPVPYRLTYTYSGYPLVREARARIAAGELGAIRKVVVEYPQGWLAQPVDNRQAEWRGDPARSGEGGCVADIGTHAFHLAEFVTGLQITEILPDLGKVVPGRRLDDDCSVLLRFENGARGALLASQIETGELNSLRFRIYGEKGGLSWRHDDPNLLHFVLPDRPSLVIRAGDANLSPCAQAATRIGGGHPEGYIEAFANLYRDFARLLRGEDAPLLPGITDGLRSMAFVSTAVRVSGPDARWTRIESEGMTP